MRLIDPDTDDQDHYFDWDAHNAAKVKRERFWTDERVAILSRDYCAGLHTETIATALGTTRNAVIGKADRLGLSHGEVPYEPYRSAA